MFMKIQKFRKSHINILSPYPNISLSSQKYSRILEDKCFFCWECYIHYMYFKWIYYFSECHFHGRKQMELRGQIHIHYTYYTLFSFRYWHQLPFLISFLLILSEKIDDQRPKQIMIVSLLVCKIDSRLIVYSALFLLKKEETYFFIAL